MKNQNKPNSEIIENLVAAVLMQAVMLKDVSEVLDDVGGQLNSLSSENGELKELKEIASVITEVSQKASDAATSDIGLGFAVQEIAKLKIEEAAQGRYSHN